MKFLNSDIYSFLEFSKDKEVVAFGAGKGLHNFLLEFNELNVESIIQYVVDNDKSKIGKMITLVNETRIITSLENVIKMNNLVILISCVDICSIFEQLNTISVLKDVVCFSTIYIRSETNLYKDKIRVYPNTFRITSDMRIPKIIHYCWFGKKPIPKKNMEWIDGWKRKCPDYEIIQWNENNYDVTKNQYMYDAYKEKKWGFVPDYARLDLIYNYGGIYLDTDVEIIRKFDELLYEEIFFGVDCSHKISLGLGFGASKKNEIIQKLRDYYDKVSFYDDKGRISNVSAPSLQEKCFEELGFKKNGEYQRIGNIAVFPERVMAAKCNLTGRTSISENTFSIHHYDASWVDGDILNKLNNNKILFNEKVELLKC